MLDIRSAWMAYLNGDLSPWDFHDVITEKGFSTFEGRPDGSVLITLAKPSPLGLTSIVYTV